MESNAAIKKNKVHLDILLQRDDQDIFRERSRSREQWDLDVDMYTYF